MSRTKKLIILGVVFVILGAVLYLTPTKARNSSYVQASFNGYTELTIRAWHETSYIYGPSTWRFFYSPNLSLQPPELNTHFPIPSFPPGVSLDHPILFLAFSTVGGNGIELTGLDATAGASSNFNGLKIEVSEVNPAYLVLLVKTVS